MAAEDITIYCHNVIRWDIGGCGLFHEGMGKLVHGCDYVIDYVSFEKSCNEPLKNVKRKNIHISIPKFQKNLSIYTYMNLYK